MFFRLALFLALLVTLLLLERRHPRRPGPMQRARRWRANFSLVLIDTALLVALRLSAAGAALYAATHGIGLFNIVDAPGWLAFGACLVLLDFAIYWQHRAMHEVRFLWPLHRVHHTDVEFDTTTGVRFHPVEILGSMGFKVLLVLLLGAPVAAVVVFEVLLSSFALFSHSNLALPATVDRVLRRVVVTPDMHRVHHSVWREETDSNYANGLTVWDHLFGSYRDAPRDGHEPMRIGLPELRDDRAQTLVALLAQPLRASRPAD